MTALLNKLRVRKQFQCFNGAQWGDLTAGICVAQWVTTNKGTAMEQTSYTVAAMGLLKMP